MTLFVLLIIMGFFHIGYYSFDRSVARGDVIDLHGQFYNYDHFESFLAHVESGKEANLRLISYTIEGDPIITDLKYSDEFINIKINNVRDRHGGDRLIHTKDRCKELISKEERAHISYWLIDCEKSTVDNGYYLLAVEKAP